MLHYLRYGLEAFFRHACGVLKAPVPYNISERWDLGEFMPAAISRLRKYVTTAADAEASWGRTEESERLRVFASVIGQTTQKAQGEQPAVNWNVHFNEWANFSRQDFEPVVESMQELYQQFICNECNGVLEATGDGAGVSVVKCPCGHVCLNQKRKKPTERMTAASM